MQFSAWALLALISVCDVCNGWTTDELALYDLVEEVGVSFYQFFDIDKDASLSEVKKAYRRLSLEWHPDRNSAEDAEQQFRKVAAIYEVLKSAEMRERYNEVLEFGLPDWRQPVYYFRRARKMSWAEALLALFLICSAGHYLMLWGAYLDRYLTLSGKNKLRKKEIRQLRKQNVVAEDAFEAQIVEQLASVRPRMRHLLPCLLISLAYRAAAAAPTFFGQCYDEFMTSREQPQEEEEFDEEGTGEEKAHRRVRPVPQPAFGWEMNTGESPAGVILRPVLNIEPHFENEDVSEKSPIPRDQKWTCDELAHLVKLSTEKYPVGTPNRWDKMAHILNRTPEDVTAMVGKLKLMRQDEYAKLLRGAQSSSVVVQAANVSALPISTPNGHVTREEDIDESVATPSESSPKECTSIGSAVPFVGVDEWSQHDQRLFETALQQFPKGTADRWDKIVNCVPNKTKQQCIERFKFLSEMVRQKKAQHRNKK